MKIRLRFKNRLFNRFFLKKQFRLFILREKYIKPRFFPKDPPIQKIFFGNEYFLYYPVHTLDFFIHSSFFQHFIFSKLLSYTMPSGIYSKSFRIISNFFYLIFLKYNESPFFSFYDLSLNSGPFFKLFPVRRSGKIFFLPERSSFLYNHRFYLKLLVKESKQKRGLSHFISLLEDTFDQDHILETKIETNLSLTKVSEKYWRYRWKRFYRK